MDREEVDNIFKKLDLLTLEKIFGHLKLEKPEKKPAAVEGLHSEATERGVKQLERVLKEAELRELCESVGLETEKGSKSILIKRFLEKVKSDGLEDVFKVAGKKILGDLFEIFDIEGDGKDVSKLADEIRAIGFENMMSTLDVQLLQDICGELKIQFSSSSNNLLIKAIRGVEEEKKEKPKTKVSDKKPPLEAGVDVINVAAHYSKPELETFCKEKNLPIGGRKKRELARLVVEFLNNGKVEKKSHKKRKASSTSKSKTAKKQKVEKEDKEKEKDKDGDVNMDEAGEKKEKKEVKEKKEKKEKAKPKKKEEKKEEKKESKKESKKEEKKEEKDEEEVEKEEKEEKKESKKEEKKGKKKEEKKEKKGEKKEEKKEEKESEKEKTPSSPKAKRKAEDADSDVPKSPKKQKVDDEKKGKKDETEKFLDGFVFAISGKFDASQAQLKADIKKYGGKVADDATTTHLLVPDPAASNPKIDKAKESKIKIVGLDFLKPPSAPEEKDEKKE